MSKEKLKALKKTIDKLNKSYGEGAVGTFNSIGTDNVECVTTGSLLFDRLIRSEFGGFPRGRFIELYGPNGSGKTSCVLSTIAEAQQRGELCAFIDVEQSYPKSLADNIGVDHDSLFFTQPDSAEQAIEIMRELAETEEFSIIALDSIAALTPLRELEGEVGVSVVGRRALLMSQACRLLPPIFRRTNTTGIWINQIREKIGVMYGNPETTPGGQAMPFAASLRIDVRKGQPIKEGDTIIGHMMKLTVKKSKISPNFGKKVEVPFYYDRGFDRFSEIVQVAVDDSIIDKAGSWFSYGELKIGQGTEKVKQFLQGNPEILKEIEEKIR